MVNLLRLFVVVLLLALLPGCSLVPNDQPTLRIATFNTALSRNEAGQLHGVFARGDDAQARQIAEVLQRTRPDIVLLQEVDYDPTGRAYTDFQRNYLSVSQNGAEPIAYEHVYAPEVNTGVLAEVDLDGDGQITRPNDCHGYGLFEGQYGMVVLSRYPIDRKAIYTFRKVLWQDLFRNNLPTDYYGPAASSRLRLSSKTHADVPIEVAGKRVHLLISHPTPPVFDGPEDRNGRRNLDEIHFWLHYLEPGAVGRAATFPKFDGGRGAWDRLLYGTNFVVMGDLNADPNDGGSRLGSIARLLDHDRINSGVVPISEGGREASQQQGGKNLTHKSDPAYDTADFGDGERGPGNLRVDYVLPSIFLDVIDAGVYWPTADDPQAYLNQASDHKLVWVDVRLP